MTAFMSGANSNAGVGSGVWGVGVTGTVAVSDGAVSPTPYTPLPTPRRISFAGCSSSPPRSSSPSPRSAVSICSTRTNSSTTPARAQWIWQQHRLAQGDPAAFFATHEFDLPPNRSFTRIKMLGDPEYTLYFNGVAIGGRHVGDDNEALDTYDVSALARDKKNRMVVAVRSANGVGGLIAVDRSDAGVREFRRHRQRLAHRAAAGATICCFAIRRRIEIDASAASRAAARAALELSRAARREAVRADAAGHRAARVFDFETALPEIAVIGGTAVTVSRKTSRDRVRLRPDVAAARDSRSATSATHARNVTVRFANDRVRAFHGRRQPSSNSSSRQGSGRSSTRRRATSATSRCTAARRRVDVVAVSQKSTLQTK